MFSHFRLSASKLFESLLQRSLQAHLNAPKVIRQREEPQQRTPNFPPPPMYPQGSQANYPQGSQANYPNTSMGVLPFSLNPNTQNVPRGIEVHSDPLVSSASSGGMSSQGMSSQ